MAKFCRFCGKPVKENAKFCENCGKSLAKANQAPVQPVCPRCGEPLDSQIVFCGNCGLNLQQGTECVPVAPIAAQETVQQVQSYAPTSMEETPWQQVVIPQIQSLTVTGGGMELDCGELNRYIFGAVSKAATEVLSPASAVTQGISSFFGGILRFFKNPKALIGTVVLTLVWFLLGWLGDSDSTVVKMLSWLTFSEGGFDRSLPGAVCGALGKGTVAAALVSLFTGGMKNTFKGVGVFFSGHGEKRDVVCIVIGVVVGIAVYFVFAGTDASGKTAMAGVGGALLSLQALGGGSGRIYELAQSLTAANTNGIRTAVAGKCDGLLTGLALGFALATVLSVIG